jgi:signal transduction histidine kinase
MSDSDYIFPSASAEFMALCKSQTFLVNQGLGAIWSAVYLTKELAEGGHRQLIPLVSNPQSHTLLQQNAPWSRLPEVLLQEDRFLPRLPSVDFSESKNHLEDTATQESQTEEKSLGTRGQLVLPLVHEDTVMGFLIAIREDRQWNQRELTQAEQIAKTLAIACCLDRRQLWYQQQLSKQENLKAIEHDRLDNFIHQLRNPLTALRTFSKLLLKRLLPEDRNQSVAQSILRESDRVQELIEQFVEEIEPLENNTTSISVNASPLTLAEIERQTSSNFLLPSNSLGKEYLSVVEILTPLLASFEAIAQEQQIELSWQLPQNLPPVQANAKALREILSNLIDNAIKYTPFPGKVEIVTGIEQKEFDRNYQGIAITDTGYGIPAEDQKHLFERHYRGIQAQGKIPGTGLGLAIAKELIEKMGGKIEVISPVHPNSNTPGTTFIVWLLV